MTLAFPENGKRAMGGLNILRGLVNFLLAITAATLALAMAGAALLFTLVCAPPLARLRQG
jgi:hypothetical protein